MPRLAAVALAVVLLAPSPAAAASQTPLARKLSRALAVPHVARAHTSALAVDLATGKQLYARNLRMPLIPASNEKLAVTYASLLALGPSFRFSTDVLGEGSSTGRSGGATSCSRATATRRCRRSTCSRSRRSSGRRASGV